ncbi:hypothetical protein KH5H1_12710 [Corallococcus caeni]|uniref:Glycosyltransferase RgtA/B/C/D-like domain-containing protein n=1 Tax=Corallococcus caeni TaxID=3082388 RepID=A0ABQ6R1E0_9BACT|nr:hypothetical protein KH5H1_12710 [Corallococcus sp. KH5-1]GMU09721.1 hypothetical protein ASNO1_59750 [Corallococcus sp. NO1]
MSDPVPSPFRLRLPLLLLCVVGVALPCLGVKFPPITDLPQHLGQVRLLLEALHDPNSPYRIQPLTPYWGAHVVLLPLWLALPLEWVGSAAVLALGMLWTATVHVLAWRRGRSVDTAVLATLFFFSQVLYWGFIPLLAGWPVYGAWLLIIQAPRISPRRGLLLFVGAALLYWFHALWFALGMLTLVLHWARTRPGWRTVLLQGAAVVPVGVLALVWFSQLSQRGFTSRTAYLRDLGNRLSPSGFTAAALGGLRDSVEGPLVLLVVLWVALGLWQHRGALRREVDGALLPPGLLMVALALALPDIAQNTILMAERWMPFGLALVVLALPTPRLPARALHAWSAALLLLLSGFTSLVWRTYEEQDLSGFEASLEATPEGSRVMGLDYLVSSSLVRGRPYLQLFAWSHVLLGARNNFSFAWFAPNPVVFRKRRAPPWSWGVEWDTRMLKPERDFRHFDYLLVGLPEEMHAQFEATMPVRAVTQQGRWRLYRTALPPAEPTRPAATPDTAATP